jgi:CheY-like chemotaxis protein
MAEQSIAGKAGRTERRVLVADDNDLNRALLEAALARLGVEAVSVQDGVRAVEAIRTGDFDLVLMDIAMPVLDGLGALRRIRAMPGEKGLVPVVAFTGAVDPEMHAELTAAGLDGFLRKPIDWRALSATIQALWAGAEFPRRRLA